MISLGSKVYASDSDIYALTGPVVRDLNGNLLVLTSRELLSLRARLQTHKEFGHSNIGLRPYSYFHSEGPEKSATKLVGWFRQSIKLSSKNLKDRIADSSEGILSCDIEIPSIKEGAVGYICGTNCFARFKLRNVDKPVVIDGLLRATS